MLLECAIKKDHTVFLWGKMEGYIYYVCVHLLFSMSVLYTVVSVKMKNNKTV